ncbi:N amino acid transport system protein [Tolypocladium ophioglossoides CBS 100239]|uniref:N amino acid transport system protein n=1 Tax=Tolypocladium ophioglossoides (strain CBS 100239) TaxID=1163406 RepID=A0A0L0N003_TOLOC|nr:N amino acid transport system protein [Tolypocladium ophioglossoides CBS 100239]
MSDATSDGISQDSKKAKARNSTHSRFASSRWAATFGGPNVDIGPRISAAPDAPDLGTPKSDGETAVTQRLRENGESGSDIKYRSCSWPKTAALLFAEYIGLAIMCFPASYSQMGWVGGFFATVLNAALYLYTSLTLWEFCVRHPEVRDICDIGRMILGGEAWGWWATAVMFVANNTGLHVIVGSEYLNTVAASWGTPLCKTVLFSGIISIICCITSLPRTFSMLSHLATFSAFFTFVSVIIATVCIAIQAHPANYKPAAQDVANNGSLPMGDPVFSAWPAPGADFVSIMVAFLGICYTFIGQITLPSFIAEMKDPRDFPKALWSCTMSQLVVFCTVGITIYKFTGIQYMTSPAFGGLEEMYKILSFSFMLPTIVIHGALYASITGRFVFVRIFSDSKHMYSHTVTGWLSWGAILMVIWVLGFVVSQVIPFFSSLLALVAAVFDAFFGFVYWGVAWFQMRSADKRDGRRVRSKEWDIVLVFFNGFLILLGTFLFLVAGTIASIQHIMQQFAVGAVKGVFSCASNSL